MDNRGRLVLGVKQGDTVLVGDDIEVTVVSTGNKTNLLFVAPKTTKILRPKAGAHTNAEGDVDVRSS